MMPGRKRKRDAEAAEITYLRRNDKLIRRAGIRRALAGRFYTKGISTREELQSELRMTTGIEAHIMTLSKDLREMGAVKVKDAENPSVQWWVMPAYNPNAEELRDQMDPEIIENEVAYRLGSHAIDIAPIGQFIYVMTEARAGYLVGYWLSWLSWNGIVYVQEQLDGCIIHCLNDECAINVAERLLGDKRLRYKDEEPT